MSDIDMGFLLGTEYDIQYWFVTLPELNKETKRFAEQEIMRHTKYEFQEKEGKKEEGKREGEGEREGKREGERERELFSKCNVLEYYKLPSLVIMFLDAQSKQENPVVEFVISHKKDMDNIGKLSTFAVNFLKENITTSKVLYVDQNIDQNQNIIKINEKTIDPACIGLFKLALTHCCTQIIQDNPIKMSIIPYY